MAVSAGLRRQVQPVSGGAAGGGKKLPGNSGYPWKMVPTDKPAVKQNEIKYGNIRLINEEAGMQTLQDILAEKDRGTVFDIFPSPASVSETRRRVEITVSPYVLHTRHLDSNNLAVYDDAVLLNRALNHDAAWVAIYTGCHYGSDSSFFPGEPFIHVQLPEGNPVSFILLGRFFVHGQAVPGYYVWGQIMELEERPEWDDWLVTQLWRTPGAAELPSGAVPNGGANVDLGSIEFSTLLHGIPNMDDEIFYDVVSDALKALSGTPEDKGFAE